MKLDTITFATGNVHKLKEIRTLLDPYGLLIRGLPDTAVLPPEIGSSFLINAEIKARYGYEITGLPTLADDSGLEVEALGGAPGVHSARYAGKDAGDDANNEKLLQALAGISKRRARFCCAMVLVLGDEAIGTEGVCDGLILDSPRGLGGFGYDPLFFLPELNKTMAEALPAEKNSVSHRARAIAKMVGILRTRGLL